MFRLDGLPCWPGVEQEPPLLPSSACSTTHPCHSRSNLFSWTTSLMRVSSAPDPLVPSMAWLYSPSSPRFQPLMDAVFPALWLCLPQLGLTPSPVLATVNCYSWHFLELSTHTHDNAGHVALGFCVPMLSDLCWLLLFILHSSPERWENNRIRVDQIWQSAQSH